MHVDLSYLSHSFVPEVSEANEKPVSGRENPLA
jgi:hypothetical protein